MRQHEIQTADHWMAQLADDPVIAADVTEPILQAAQNDRGVFVVVRAGEPQAGIIEKGEPQQTKVPATFFRDFEVLLLVLYAGYALIVVGAAALLLLQWDHVP